MNRGLKASSDATIALQREAVATAIFRSASVVPPGLRGRKGSADGLQSPGFFRLGDWGRSRLPILAVPSHHNSPPRTATIKETE